MSKKEFLKKLGKELGTLPRSEMEKTLAYYDELIEDRKESGATEEAAVYAMGDIKTIAAEILSDAKERGVELKKHGMPTFVKVLLISLAVIVLAAGVGLGDRAPARIQARRLRSRVGEGRKGIRRRLKGKDRSRYDHLRSRHIEVAGR